MCEAKLYLWYETQWLSITILSDFNWMHKIIYACKPDFAFHMHSLILMALPDIHNFFFRLYT